MNEKTLPLPLTEAVQTLVESLNAVEPLVAYREAQAALAADDAAMALLQRLATAQGSFRRRQMEGAVTQEALDELRALQNDVLNHPVTGAYLNAQQGATAYLPVVNRGITAWLGVDFASLGRSVGCC